MRKISVLMMIFIFLGLSASAVSVKKMARVVPIEDQSTKNYQIAPRFSSAEVCTVRHDGGAAWAIEHWVTGAELYKSYQDPSQTCSGPYPFTVEDIYVVLYFAAATSLIVSVDVESVDLTDPGCPGPGLLLSISQAYQVDIPGSGLYQIVVPLDSPAVVSGPYFAGFYISDLVDTLAGISLVTDSFPLPCVSYNIWDTTIGFVDLDSTGFPEFPQFPGRMLLFSSGQPGGGGGVQPEPAITILSPELNEKLTGTTNLWAVETAGSDIIEYVQFDYRNGVDWFEIGRDYIGDRALRNGVDAAGIGNGYSIDWDYSSIAEGTYWLRAIVNDTLGRTNIDSFQISIDPTPPDPTLTNPTPLDTICLPMALAVSSLDENLTNVVFEKKSATYDYQLSPITLNQANYGDNNGTPGDGNPASSGEYGDYYCGPTSAAIAIQYWFNMGFIYIMREGNQYLSIDTVVERLAVNMQTRRYNGTYDDAFYYGLQQYIVTHGNELRLKTYWEPDYSMFRTLLQERELFLILGLGGSPGLYLAAAGATGLQDSSGQFAIRASDPITGTLIDTYMRDIGGHSEILYNGTWHTLDVIFTVMGWSHSVTRDFVGLDNSAAGGWSFDWSSSDLVEDSLYFVTATANDATGRTEMTSALVQYSCFIYSQGDYNGDGNVNVGDALYLLDFIYKGASPPVGGAARADANCDGNIDISDIVTIIKHVYGVGPAPCY